MSDTQTIEKLNEALTQLIEAYKDLQDKNKTLEKNLTEANEKINELEAKNKDLEYKISDFSSNRTEQDSKMGGMLSKIQSLLKTSEPKEESTPSVGPTLESIEASNNDSILDIKLDTTPNDTVITSSVSSKRDTTKIDLERMESLLNNYDK